MWNALLSIVGPRFVKSPTVPWRIRTTPCWSRGRRFVLPTHAYSASPTSTPFVTGPSRWGKCSQKEVLVASYEVFEQIFGQFRFYNQHIENFLYLMYGFIYFQQHDHHWFVTVNERSWFIFLAAFLPWNQRDSYQFLNLELGRENLIGKRWKKALIQG